MTSSFQKFLALEQTDRQDIFEASAQQLNTPGSYIEKDFWVCLVLDILYNQLPDEHPDLLFKGGTSLSKVFNLIQRFSEDIDLVVYRRDLGFEGEVDPTNPQSSVSKSKRRKLFGQLQATCSNYITSDLRMALKQRLPDSCEVQPDPDDSQTLLITYLSTYSSLDTSYVQPRVKVEAGARSALTPSEQGRITPYISQVLPDWPFEVAGLKVISPQRTFWEKVLILHGLLYGYRDEGRLPRDRNRLSRHYYDVAAISATDIGKKAISNLGLLDAVREHNLIAFNQAWKKFELAQPGTLRIVPSEALRAAITADYKAMRGMIWSQAPEFEWIIHQLQTVEEIINRQ